MLQEIVRNRVQVYGGQTKATFLHGTRASILLQMAEFKPSISCHWCSRCPPLQVNNVASSPLPAGQEYGSDNEANLYDQTRADMWRGCLHLVTLKNCPLPRVATAHFTDHQTRGACRAQQLQALTPACAVRSIPQASPANASQCGKHSDGNANVNGNNVGGGQNPCGGQNVQLLVAQLTQIVRRHEANAWS